MSVKLFLVAEKFEKKLKKEAGLVKVPQKLVQEIFEWSKGLIAERFLKKTEKKIQKIKERKIEVNVIKEAIEQKEFQLIKSSYNDLDQKLKNFVINRRKFLCKLPKFNKIENRTFSYELGSGHSFLLEIIKNNNNLFDIEFDFPENESLNFSEVDLTVQELTAVINKHAENIFEAVDKIRDICDYFDEYSEEDRLSLEEDLKFYSQIADWNGQSDIINKQFYFSVQDLPYPASFPFLIRPFIEATIIFDPKLKAGLSNEEWVGLFCWNGIQDTSRGTFCGSIKIDAEMPDKEEENIYSANQTNFQIFLKNIKETIKHELIHFIQLFYSEIKSIKNKRVTFGHPHRSLQGEIRAIKPSENDLDHKLRQIEFYSNLENIVDDFNHLKEKYNFPNEVWNYIIKVYCGVKNRPQNDWEISNELNFKMEEYKGKAYWLMMEGSFNLKRNHFLKLKENQPLKWKKMVKEFYKAVTES